MGDAGEISYQSRIRGWRHCLVLIGVVAGVPCELPAQRMSPGFALGVAVPVGDFGEIRRVGPLANLSLTFGGPERRVRFRVEGEAAWLPSRVEAPPLRSFTGDLRILSALASVRLAANSGRVRPFLVFGGGPQWLSVPNDVNPYGMLFGVRAAAGLEGKWSGRKLKAELGAHAVLSDYGTGRDFGLGTFLPFMVGLQF